MWSKARMGLATGLCLAVLLAAGCSSSPWPETPPPPPVPARGQWLEGKAAWYGELFQGRATTSGEQFNMAGLTGSHASLPLGAQVEVEYPKTGKKVVVTINDRHNLENGRDLCLSKAAAEGLGAYPLMRFPVRYQWVR